MKAAIGRQDIPGLVIIAITGLALSFLGFSKIKKASEAKKWPVTYGTVTSSEVAGAIKYYPSISYTYTVDSVVYDSKNISVVNFNTKNKSVVVDFLKKYPSGSTVKVFYNNTDPSDAFLEPGINTGNILLLAFGAVLMAIPILSVIFIKVDLRKASGTVQ